MTYCPFCHLHKSQIILENKSAVSIFDINPANPGHMLIIPKKHVHTVFDLNAQQVQDMHSLLVRTKHYLDKQFHPGGYQIEINCYPIGGQNIQHVHIHIMPRYVRQRRCQQCPRDKSWNNPKMYKYDNPGVNGAGYSSKHAWRIENKVAHHSDSYARHTEHKLAESYVQYLRNNY